MNNKYDFSFIIIIIIIYSSSFLSMSMRMTAKNILFVCVMLIRIEKNPPILMKAILNFRMFFLLFFAIQ